MPILNDAIASNPTDAAQATLAGILDRLEQAFATRFAVMDVERGELLERATPPGTHWDVRAELCRAVAQTGQPEFIEEEDPLLVLAVPLGAWGCDGRVAVGTFLTRTVCEPADHDKLGAMLGLDREGAVAWASRQIVWSPEAILRVAKLLGTTLAEERRNDALENEAEMLSRHLTSTYEEISLLYRLTRNLKLSQSDEELGRLALDWLTDVLPAEGVALQLVPLATADGDLTPQARTESLLLTQGDFPLDNEQFTRLIEYLDVGLPNQPVVVNRRGRDEDDWPFAEVRQVIAVPLVEGENLFGWLAGVNHVANQEFGTVEASLLSSVGTLLGIHSGNIELYRQQSELLAGIVRALTSAIDAKDRYTCGHSDRVAKISVRLAQELGCDPEMVKRIYLAGMLHDIGKIGIDDSVLRKPGALTDEEYDHIKRHVNIGHRILQDLRKLDDLLPVILHHHESWDGSGYPHRLPAEKIPFAARIVAVADAFDAMGSDRPYRKGLPDEKIDAIFRSGSGKQWDPEVVDAFFRVRDELRDIVRRDREDLQIEIQPWV